MNYEGPSDQTLKHLAAMLPAYAEAVASKKIGGKGRKEMPRVPRQICPVCGTGADYGPMTKPLPDPVNCVACQKDLDAGFIAFTCGDRYVIAKSTRLADMGGKIINLSPPVFDKLVKEYHDEWEVKSKSDGSEEPPKLASNDSFAA